MGAQAGFIIGAFCPVLAPGRGQMNCQEQEFPDAGKPDAAWPFCRAEPAWMTGPQG